jgi:SpoVK/Ycf46/Vps4 family AAA+-type ATPase
MATSEQIIALIKAHYDVSSESFNTIALQIAAYEAKCGHNVMATEIKKIVDKHRIIRPAKNVFMNPALSEMMMEEYHEFSLQDLISSASVKEKIDRIISEYQQRDILQKYGLCNRSKILLGGPSGTGKTMTASVIARELELPLYVIRIEKILTKYMGETSAKLGQVFDVINVHEGIYLFDEFDAIGTERSRDNEVGEMRRILNSFLQFVERVNANSIIIAATNHMEMLDKALFRRFDDIVTYTLPSNQEIKQLLDIKLEDRINKSSKTKLITLLQGLSHADICSVCMDALKESILTNQPMTFAMVKKMISNRMNGYNNIAC